MIYDSGIWKQELKEQLTNIKELIYQTEFSMDWLTEDTEDGETESYHFFIKLQKFCFYSAVIARKFIESGRLSDEFLSKSYKVVSFPKKSKGKLTKYNFESIEDDYDLLKEKKETINLSKFCNLLIHSFIFNPELIEEKIDKNLPEEDLENWDIQGIKGLYLNTDHTKDKKVYYIDLDTVFNIFKLTSENQVLKFSMDFENDKIVRSNKK